MGFYTIIKTLSQMFIYFYFRGGWAQSSQAQPMVEPILVIY